MKKIILIILLLCTTGCYDYIELNDLSIITGISVDYAEENYLVGFEILNAQKTSSGEEDKKSFTVEGQGKNIAEAFNNAAKETPKKPYYTHLKCLIISEDIAEDYLKNIVDFLVRNSELRNEEFIVVLAGNSKAISMLKNSSENNPIVSATIENMIKNNKYYKNNSSSKSFDKMLTDILTYGKDATMTVINKEDKNFNIVGIGAFKDYKLQDILSSQETITYNVLNNNVFNAYYTKKCDKNDLNMTISIYDSKTDYKVKNNRIKITAELEATIVENNCNIDLHDTNVYLDLDKQFSKILKKDINKLVEKSINLKSDILGLGQTYYIATRRKSDDLWLNLDYEVDVKLKVNKKGLIFEVKHD